VNFPASSGQVVVAEKACSLYCSCYFYMPWEGISWYFQDELVNDPIPLPGSTGVGDGFDGG
jgi:hypothetical protein